MRPSMAGLRWRFRRPTSCTRRATARCTASGSTRRRTWTRWQACCRASRRACRVPTCCPPASRRQRPQRSPPQRHLRPQAVQAAAVRTAVSGTSRWWWTRRTCQPSPASRAGRPWPRHSPLSPLAAATPSPTCSRTLSSSSSRRPPPRLPAPRRAARPCPPPSSSSRQPHRSPRHLRPLHPSQLRRTRCSGCSARAPAAFLRLPRLRPPRPHPTCCQRCSATRRRRRRPCPPQRRRP
mmetsp:Transcript_37585/g.94916  ORF Transcript_37585/g.94916 Transcript_37585/m.94916 type:complete len:237 (+) Transcript_37585:384-1094(+)